MTEEGWDINEEYEKIFGSREHINLFDTEEEYNDLVTIYKNFGPDVGYDYASGLYGREIVTTLW